MTHRPHDWRTSLPPGQDVAVSGAGPVAAVQATLSVFSLIFSLVFIVIAVLFLLLLCYLEIAHRVPLLNRGPLIARGALRVSSGDAMAKQRETGDSELQEVIRAERRRGRRQVDEALRRAKRLLVRELLAEEDKATFIESIRALGLQEGSPRWDDALKAWHDERRERERGRRGRR